MTKLAQWLAVGGLFLVVWYSLVADVLPVSLSNEVYEVILPVSVFECACCSNRPLSVMM